MSNFVIAVIVLASLVATWRLYVHGKATVIDYFDRKRMKQIVDRLKKIGPLFCAHVKGDVIALCTLKNFDKAVVEYNNKVGTEGGPKAWKKVIVCVNPTFTFAGSEQSLRPAHTGKREDLEAMVRRMLEIMFDKNDCLYSSRFIEEVAKILIRKDSRLYVPFIGDEYQKEWDDYDHMQLYQAQDFFAFEVKQATKLP